MWHTAGTQQLNVIHDSWTYWFRDETLKRVESALLQSATPSASDTDINQSINHWSIPSSQRSLLSVSIINHLVDLWEAISLWWLSSDQQKLLPHLGLHPPVKQNLSHFMLRVHLTEQSRWDRCVLRCDTPRALIKNTLIWMQTWKKSWCIQRGLGLSLQADARPRDVTIQDGSAQRKR